MSKIQESGYIIFSKENMTNEDRLMAEMYWAIDPSNPRQFLYPAQKIASKFGLRPIDLTREVKALYPFSVKLPWLVCSTCKSNLYVSTRSEYQKLPTNFICSNCLKQKAKAEEVNRVNAVAVFKTNYLKADYSVDDLSYIETIFVYLWLTNGEYSFPSIQKIPRNSYSTITGIGELDEIIISNLTKKGIVLRLDEPPMDLAYQEECGKNSDSAGIYLKQSIQYEDMYEFCANLYNKIHSRNISYSDIEEISYSIDTVRMNNLYNLVIATERHFRLEIKRTNLLDGVLLYISRKYPLYQCCQLIFNQAQKVAAHIHSSTPDPFAIPHLFTKFLDRQISNIEAFGWDVYEKKLPRGIQTSQWESFGCQLAFSSEFNWFQLNTQQVKEDWIGSLNILE